MGAVYACGSGQHGQIGDGATNDRARFVCVRIAGGVSVRAVAAGSRASAAVVASNPGSPLEDVLLWGCAEALGRPADAPAATAPFAAALGRARVAVVSVGWAHVLWLEEAGGRVFALGSNAEGQLGAPPALLPRAAAPVLVPLPAAASSLAAAGFGGAAVVADARGSVFTWGRPGLRGVLGRAGPGLPPAAADLPPLAAGERPARVACGWEHMAVVTSRANLVLWGANADGQCARPPGAAPPAPRPPGRAPLAPGATRVRPRRGGPRRAACAPAWATLPSGGATDVRCGWHHTLVLLAATGDVLHAGRAPPGAAAASDGDDLWRRVPLPDPAVAISAGGAHSAALCRPARLFVWGWNEHGNLGLGDHADRSSSDPAEVPGNYSAVACGGAHTLSLFQEN